VCTKREIHQSPTASQSRAAQSYACFASRRYFHCNQNTTIPSPPSFSLSFARGFSHKYFEKKKLRKKILRESIRAKETKIEPLSLHQVSQSMQTNFGYGIATSPDKSTEEKLMHFKTGISTSYIILGVKLFFVLLLFSLFLIHTPLSFFLSPQQEYVASQAKSSAKRKPTMNIREYVDFLQTKFKSVEPNLWNFYIETYERAKFSPDEFSWNEYSEFMEIFGRLLQSIDPEVGKRDVSQKTTPWKEDK
jgi:hypothetical protein